MSLWSELFPHAPAWTEADMTDQCGRVFIVTGGASGIGYEVAKTLYHLNGRVYIFGRSAEDADRAISAIRASSLHPSLTVQPSCGTLHFLPLDLADLSTIKPCASAFLSKEPRLDILFHNAGIMGPPPGSLSPQNHDLTLATNVLGPFLLQHFLTPLLLHTCTLTSTLPNATRAVFVAAAGHRSSPRPDGVAWDDLSLASATGLAGKVARTNQSKAMAVMLAAELARRYGHGAHGLVALSCHPGICRTRIRRHQEGALWFRVFEATAARWVLSEASMGALTVLWSGLGAGVEARVLGETGNGGFVWPWGRFVEGVGGHVFEGLRERGTGERLWGLCEELVGEFM